MKNLELLKKITILLLGGGLLVSCSDFFESNDFKEKLDKDIAYAQAKECRLIIKSDSKYGAFLSDGEKSCKVGYTTSVQFTVNQNDYKFNGLEAVSAKDPSVNYNSLVEFTTTEKDEKNGTYKITIKLLKEANDILIRPNCILLPKITAITPNFESSGVDQDTPIEITFNKAMEAESFAGFSGLSITSDGEELGEYFSEIYFYEDNTKLYILPLAAVDNSKLLLQPSGSVQTRNITIAFKFSGNEKDCNGLAITQNKEYTYKINTNLGNSLPSADVEITGSNGKFSPTKGTYSCIKTFTYQLSFDPDSDYEFIRWQIYDMASESEIENGTYIKLENPLEPATNYSLVPRPLPEGVKLAVRPVVAERPQILSYAPLYVAEGSLKDSTIQVVFDYDMDESSIYFTKEEIKKLNAEGIPYTDFFPVVEEYELSESGELKNHYGYKKNVNGKEEYFYKNISIKDNDTYENLTHCFDAPVFTNSKTLTIMVRKVDSEDGKSKQVLFSDYTQFLVTLEKNFSYSVKISEEKSKNVGMAGSKKWIYLVSDGLDTVKPKVANEGDVKIWLTTATDENLEELSSLSSSPAVSASTNFNNHKKLKIDVKSTDSESGPNGTFALQFQRVKNEKYENVTEDAQTKTIKYQKVTTMNGVYKNEIDVSTLDNNVKLDNGVYKVNFKFSDRSGNDFVYPASGGYYFTVDEVNTMAEASVNDTSADDSNYKLKLTWSQADDLAKTEIKYKKSSEESWSAPVTVNRGTTYKEFSNLASDTAYDFEVTYTDFANNVETKSVNKTTSKLDSITVSGTPSKTFYFTGQNFDKTGLTVKAKLTNGNQWTVNSSKWSTDYNKNSYGINKNFNVQYTSDEITKTAKINATYNVARAAAITESPVHTTGDYYQFGNFPQTLKTSSVSLTSSPIYKGYGSSTNNWYLGSDGWFYEKCQEKACTIGSIYYVSTRTKVANASANSYKYFKIEPITWKKLTDNYNGYKLLIATKSIDSGIPFYSSTSNRTINGKTIYPNNYKYSTIRAYLNGSAYEDGDNQQPSYSGKGFFQTAFSTTAQSKIKKVTLDNNSQFKSGYIYDKYFYPYSCDSTEDKVFLLGMKEMINTSYGFSDYSYASYGSNDCDERTRYPTDYALASGHYRNIDDSYANYHLRTASYTYSNDNSNSTEVWEVLGKGDVQSSGEVSESYCGIVPALCVSTLP